MDMTDCFRRLIEVWFDDRSAATEPRFLEGKGELAGYGGEPAGVWAGGEDAILMRTRIRSGEVDGWLGAA